MTESATLTVRGLYTDDWENLFNLWNSPEIMLNSLELPYTTEESFRERFSNPPANLHVLVAETGLMSGRKRLVGAVCLDVYPNRRRHTAQLTLTVYPDFQGTEAESGLLRVALQFADNWLGLRRLETTVFVDHTTLLDLYNQHRFEIEATMRRYAIRDGIYASAHKLARLRTGTEANPS